MKTTEDIREFNFQIALSEKEWEELEKYAKTEGKDLQQYLLEYFKLGIATAQREGYIYHAFAEYGDDIKKGIVDMRNQPPLDR